MQLARRVVAEIKKKQKTLMNDSRALVSFTGNAAKILLRLISLPFQHNNSKVMRAQLLT